MRTMLALIALALAAAVTEPAPQPQRPPSPAATPAAGVPPAAVPTASPGVTASPVPAASPTAAPTIPPEPVATPTAVPHPTPTLFAYVVDPPASDGASPRIVEIAVNGRTVHAGQMLLVKITTSADVTSLFVRTMGRQMAVPFIAPGVFAGQQQLPSWIPGFLVNRTYQVDVVASTADGKTTTFTIPLRLER